LSKDHDTALRELVRDVLRVGLERALSLLEAERGFFARTHPSRGVLALLAGVDRAGHALALDVFERAIPVARSALESGRSISSDTGEASVVAAVVSAGAVLSLERSPSRPFTRDQVRLLESFARSLAALESAADRSESEGRGERLEIPGRSPAIERVKKLIERVAETDFPVLLEGEPGTEKELIARAIHQTSTRRSGPFLTIDSASLGGALLEDELFGRAPGASEEAPSESPGVLERARGGTCFLDDIGAMSLEIQARLLAVLQDRRISRRGATAPTAVDVRIVAATAHDLHEQTRGERFREDLYFRLAVLKLRLPPLRERREDVRDLIVAALARHAAESGVAAPPIEGPALDHLARYDWPGNASEVDRAALRFLAVGGDRVTRATAEQYVAEALASRPSSPRDAIALAGTEMSLEEIERTVIESRLRAHDWYQKKTARSLGIDRKTLYRKIREYGLATEHPSRDERERTVADKRESGATPLASFAVGTDPPEGSP
jgi:DNA-binding NtrC family response regulator